MESDLKCAMCMTDFLIVWNKFRSGNDKKYICVFVCEQMARGGLQQQKNQFIVSKFVNNKNNKFYPLKKMRKIAP